MRLVLSLVVCRMGLAADERFASMCIASEALSAKESEVLARRCALQVCSLMLTTAPAEPPLVMVHGLSERQVKLVERAGADNEYNRLNKQSATKVSKLVLVDQGIGPAGAAELAETLKTNTHLTSLDLIGNAITSEGAAMLAEALQENYVLTSLFANADDEARKVVGPC